MGGVLVDCAERVVGRLYGEITSVTLSRFRYV